ncbi:hypothetical protein JG687_00010362 [Phytophthora cactorum]|uniref:HAT C-terminal dimerisation domain-containing protein n=1 Tax=Phytophthora cactorum TaxID=29920 RepID=A0A329R974_9STRA|nr:hypothetical protein Pcac1_g4492 [Phytophthora cactorum]KAG2795032.1 hypothetical protein PC111_g22325 [Phytophthora cactorum]KAG2809569.1 hypothetical protein PC112_g16444 [Phytophthora cactorum]KAG2852728.1 hypothetical protein PC113_g14775 [Phytophthora cactorum]KAG2882587.1 hypothetical protein PC115_g21905 [Phytophthora cactorum]
MLGFALHPLYAETARELPDTAVSGIGALVKALVYYYCRLFSTEDIGQIRRDMLAWMKGRFTRTKPSEFPGSPWEFWESVATQRPKSMLSKLAMRVLSIAVNTATYERLFSELGAIHTAKRNRLDANKPPDLQIVAQHVRQRELQEEACDARKTLLIPASERQIAAGLP